MVDMTRLRSRDLVSQILIFEIQKKKDQVLPTGEKNKEKTHYRLTK